MSTLPCMFKELAIGDEFIASDRKTPYVKKSSRTATALPGHPVPGRWFYFQQDELVYPK